MSRYGDGSTLPGSETWSMLASATAQLTGAGGGAIAAAPGVQPMSMHCREQC